MIPWVVAAHLWGYRWSRKRVLFLSDNAATVASVNSWLPKDRHLTALLKRLAKLAILHGFQVKAEHIPGLVNTNADLLSRGKIPLFQAANPQAHSSASPVPWALVLECLAPPEI